MKSSEMPYSKIQFFTILIIIHLFMVHKLSAGELGLDNVSLWLPKAYESHSEALRSAANVINETEKCHRLLSGKLLEGKSNHDHLVFTFRCRTIERYSFSVEFDNNTQQIMDPYEPFARLKEQERLLLLEQERLQEEQKQQDRVQKELARKEQEKVLCQKRMSKRINEFKEPEILKESLTGPIVKENMILYRLFFDSKSSKGKTLFYKVECKIVADNDYQLKVSPREKAMKSIK